MRVPEAHHETGVTPVPAAEVAADMAVSVSLACENRAIFEARKRQEASDKVIGEPRKSQVFSRDGRAAQKSGWRFSIHLKTLPGS
jgi:hypothetical protein